MTDSTARSYPPSSATGRDLQLAAQSHVVVSFEERNTPRMRMRWAAGLSRSDPDPGTQRQDALLARLRLPSSRARARDAPDRETPFYPRSPYGRQALRLLDQQSTIAKLRPFRCNGILSTTNPRKGRDFRQPEDHAGVRPDQLGLQDRSTWGTSKARGLGPRPQYVEAQWLMLAAEKPGGSRHATGEHTGVREFVVARQRELGMQSQEGKRSRGRDSSERRCVVHRSAPFRRPK